MDPASPKIYSLVESQPKARVVHCSDPRFQRAFREFISDELQLRDGDYIPLVISGGVGSLSEPLKLPKEFKFMKERIQLFLDRFESITRIVLINHEDCRHYEALKDLLGKLFLNRVAGMVERQKLDLSSVARSLIQLFDRKTALELYYAHFADADRKLVRFDRIEV